MVAALPANADPGDGIAINGTFTAFSDGQWAKTNDSYHDETSVTQTWTVTSTCTTYQDCTGRVTSDQGWSGDLVYLSGRWKVAAPLRTGSPVTMAPPHPGNRSFTFWKGYPDPALKGWDTTQGPERRMRMEQGPQHPAAVYADTGLVNGIWAWLVARSATNHAQIA